MASETNEKGRKWYITEKCFVDPDQHILINNGSATPRLGGLPWRLLECLMSQPNIIVQYQTISQYVWNDSEHISAHIAHLWTLILIQCVSGLRCSSFLSKPLRHRRFQAVRLEIRPVNGEAETKKD